MTLLGSLCLWLAFLIGIWGALVGFLGGLRDRPDLQRSARNAVFAMCGALVVAVFSLEWALFHHDFNIEYVAAYTSRNLPIYYTWSAFYAGQKGSLLFWAIVLSLFGSAGAAARGPAPPGYLPYVAGVVCDRRDVLRHRDALRGQPVRAAGRTRPLDGSGLNPQLQNPGMVIHPPMLYLGYIRITIPFAFAIARADLERLDTGWITRSASGRSCRGCSCRSASCSGCGGRTSSWAGAATGPGTRSRTRRCCRGSR